MNRRIKNNNNNGLRQSIRRINREINPCVKVSPARAQPNPCTTSRTKWVERAYFVQKAASSNNTASLITIGDLSTALSGLPSGTNIKVKSVSVWNTNLGGAIRADLDANVLTIGVDIDSVVGLDYGSANHLAGIKYDIPDVTSQTIESDTSSATVILTCIDPRSIAVNHSFVARFSVAIQI